MAGPVRAAKAVRARIEKRGAIAQMLREAEREREGGGMPSRDL